MRDTATASYVSHSVSTGAKLDSLTGLGYRARTMARRSVQRIACQLVRKLGVLQGGAPRRMRACAILLWQEQPTERRGEMIRRILSADSHVLEPPDLWTTRMSAKFRETAPRLIHEFKGQTGDFLYAAPLAPFNVTSLGSAGIPPAQLAEFALGGYKVCRPGGWDPAERLKDMALDGVAVEIFYCGMGMFLFGHPDEAYQRDALRAYNDFAAAYASYCPERLLPVAAISMTDVEEAVQETERCARMGFCGVLISNDPAPERRYDNPMWEPFWALCEERDLPINLHILTGQRGTGIGNHVIADYMKLHTFAVTSIF